MRRCQGEGRLLNNISIQIHSRIRSQSVFKVQRILHFVKFKFCTNPTQTRDTFVFWPENLIRQLKQPQDVSSLQIETVFSSFPAPGPVLGHNNCPGVKGIVAVAPWHVSTRQETSQSQNRQAVRAPRQTAYGNVILQLPFRATVTLS